MKLLKLTLKDMPLHTARCLFTLLEAQSEEMPLDSALMPKEVRENVWLQPERQTFYIDISREKKEVYIKADNLVAWNEWVIDELYTVDWGNLSACGFDVTAKLEVRWEESWHFGGQWGSFYSDVPEWALRDVVYALVDIGFRVIEFVNCETGEVRSKLVVT